MDDRSHLALLLQLLAEDTEGRTAVSVVTSFSSKANNSGLVSKEETKERVVSKIPYCRKLLGGIWKGV